MKKSIGEIEKKRILNAREIILQYGGDENYSGWDKLEENFDIIHSAMNLCYEYSDIDNYVYFQKRITRFLIARGHKDEDLIFEQQMIELEKSYPGNDGLLWALANRVLHMIYQGRIEEAEATILILDEDFKEIKDIAGLAHMERHKGEIEEFKGNYFKAEEHYHLSHEALKKLKYRKNEENPFKRKPNRILAINCKIGSIRRLQNDLLESESCLCSVLKYGDKKGLFLNNGIDTKLLFEIANLEFDKDNLEYARRIYLKVLENQKKEKYYRYIALSKLGLGRTCNKLREKSLAVINLKDALSKFAEIGDNKNYLETQKILENL